MLKIDSKEIIQKFAVGLVNYTLVDGLFWELNIPIDIDYIEISFQGVFEINKYFKVSYSTYDKQVIKKYAIEQYVHYLKTKSTDKTLMIAKQCSKLLRFKAPFRTFLSYYRYRNKLS